MKCLVFLMTLVVTNVSAQKLTEYKSSNGITYHVGDTVKLGRGSAPTHDFQYVQVGGMASTSGGDLNLPHTWSGRNAIIKKISTSKVKGSEKIYFTVGVGLLSNYYLLIEDAIATCEVTPCKDSTPAASSDKYDQLKKLKELLDAGAISQEEYDKEKAKILGQ